MAKILIFSENASQILVEMLAKLKHKAVSAESFDKAVDIFKKEQIDLVIIDQQSNNKSALKSLAAINNLGNSMPVIIFTRSANSSEIIEAMRLGAFDHLNSPLDFDELQGVIERAVRKPKPETAADLQLIGEDFLVGLSPVMRQVEKIIGMAAACDAPVLITGETGTGKDSVARTVHKHSLHKNEPLTILDCTAVPENYELFQNIIVDRKGTVMLDEIGDLNLRLQSMLIRALKEAQIETTLERSSNARIIATTQYDLVNMVKEKRFREDLYYRLNVIAIKLPPLKERGSDILALAETFLSQARPDGAKRLSGGASKLLLEYSWPGNVRELQNLMYHLTATVPSMVISESDLALVKATNNKDDEVDGLDYYKNIAAMEKRLLIKALEKSNGSRIEAARLLGINRQLLYAKLKAHRLMN